MQTNNGEVFSYPYLSEGSNDYINSSFKVRARAFINPDTNEITFVANYEIINDYINKLIAEKIIKVVCKLSCRRLGFVRTIDFPSDGLEASFRIDSLDVDGDVEIDCYIIANEQFNMESDSFSKLWLEEKPYIEKGNLLGESNTYIITVDHNKDGGKQSIVSFIKEKEDTDYFTYDLTGDRIVFKLPPKIFKNYVKVSDKNAESVIVDFLIPTFAQIFNQMNEKDKDSNQFNLFNRDKNWFKVLSNKYEKLFGTSPKEGSIDPLVAAQSLLKVGNKNISAILKEMNFVVKAREQGVKND